MKSLMNDEFEVIFIDWHGVLGLRGFWCNEVKHNKELSRWIKRVFEDKALVEDWMRGEKGLTDLPLLSGYTKNNSEKYLRDSFEKDAHLYGTAWPLLNLIKSRWPNSKKVLLSDNMDIFRDNFLGKNDALRSYFDNIILSCDFGCLKIDQGKNLFDCAQNIYNISDFKNCLLIDDDERNINLFNKSNGRTIHLS